MEPQKSLLWHEKLAKCFSLPQRHIVALLFFTATFNTHTHIAMLSTTLPEMVKRSDITLKFNVTEICESFNTSLKPPIENPTLVYDYSEHIQGIILSSFYWGFVTTYVPGAFFNDELANKYIFGLAVLGSTICTLVIPCIIFLEHKNWRMLIALRVLAGFFEGIVFPAMDSMYQHWIPPTDRITLSVIRTSGALSGTIFSFLLGGLLISATEIWSSVFYIFGSLGIAWFCFWQLLGYSRPKHNPFLTTAEKSYIENNLKNREKRSWRKIPWGKVSASVPFWMLILGEIGHNWGWYLMMTQLPRYLKTILNFTTKETAYCSALPFCFYWFWSGVFGHMFDLFLKTEYVSLTTLRKTFCVVGALGSGIFMLLVSYAACDGKAVVAWFTVAMSFMSAHSVGVKVTVHDLSPTYGGSLIELVDGFGNISGMMVPYFVGLIVNHQSIHEWRYVFWISFFAYATASFGFLIFGTAEVAPWDPLFK